MYVCLYVQLGHEVLHHPLHWIHMRYKDPLSTIARGNWFSFLSILDRIKTVYGNKPNMRWSLSTCTGNTSCSRLTASISCSVATKSWLWTWFINSALWAPFIPPEELDDDGEEKPKSDIFLLKIENSEESQEDSQEREEGKAYSTPAISSNARSAVFTWPSPRTLSGLPGWASFKMAGHHSIVEYFGDSGGHRCGYCGSSSTNHSHGK